MNRILTDEIRAGGDLARNAWARLTLPADVGQLPDFLIIGAQKAGTTTLVEALRRHPDVFIPDTRRISPRHQAGEVRFFCRRWRRGVRWYRSLFAPGVGRVCGEKTPGYMCDGAVMERVRRTVPEAKLIVSLRSPVDRLFSQLNMRWPRVKLSIAEALSHPDYFDRGCYARLLEEHVLSRFPRERVLIQVVDEVDPAIAAITDKAERKRRIVASQTAEVCRFLGVEPIEPPREQGFVYEGGAARPVTRDEVARATAAYEPENQRLFALLGRRIEAWDHSVYGARATA